MSDKRAPRDMRGASGTKALKFLSRDPAVHAAISVSKKLGVEAFLVGGVLRDLSLGQAYKHEFDFAVSSGAGEFSQWLARILNGSPFTLDVERSIHRVALKDSNEIRHIDTAVFKGINIEADLMERDFTINALAVNVTELLGEVPINIIDPTGGLKDAKDRILRPVSDGIIVEDPLRALRGVRLAATLSLDISPETRELIKANAKLIKGVSSERIRDELFIIFAAPTTASTLATLHSLNLFELIFPELAPFEVIDGYDLPAHVLAVMEEVDELLLDLDDGPLKRVASFFEGSTGGVRNSALLKLAALLHDSGKPATMLRTGETLSFKGHDGAGASLAAKGLKRLKFSKKSVAIIKSVVDNHHRSFSLGMEVEPTVRARYRFFSSLGEEAALITLALAFVDMRATRRLDGRGGDDPALVKFIEEMVDFYEDIFKKAPPQPLITGGELIEELSIAAGPFVGELLREVAEAEAAGEVSSRFDAVALARRLMEEKKGS